jgi:AraC-like DNA-binding protein
MTAKAFACRYAGTTNGRRYEMWRDEFARRWLCIDFTPVTGNSIANEIRCSEHSFLALCAMRGTPLHMERRADPAADAHGHRYLILASGSRLQACQHGRSIELASGRMTLMSADEPAQLTQLSEGSRWSIRIQQKLLADVCRNVDDRIAQPLDVGGELTRLLSQQIETAHRLGPRLEAPANHAIAQHLLDLVGLCLGADRDAAQVARRRGLATARLDAVKAEILRDIGRSDLGLARIAARHGLSARYIQYLFELSGTSFTSFVLEQRLLLAHRLLHEPKSRLRKISDIAATAGFSDISYFNRAFRARFGATPTDIRVGARPEASDERTE